ncbi:MAG: cytidylate kinase-like family protein [bacterium]|nr:cytidylate kinase-like family protein [bacterium]
MGKRIVITIGRQYGSGGRITGKNLASEMGIHFYDEEILKLTSEKSAIGETYFRLADEKAGNNLLYRIVDHLKPQMKKPSLAGNVVSPDNLFLFQSEMICRLAREEEACIIAGRCADYILYEANQLDLVLIRVFVYADMPTKIQRVMDVDTVNVKEAVRRIQKIDKERKEYYSYYTGKDWMDMTNYDLAINTSDIDLEQTAKIIKDYIRLKGYQIVDGKVEELTQ